MAPTPTLSTRRLALLFSDFQALVIQILATMEARAKVNLLEISHAFVPSHTQAKGVRKVGTLSLCKALWGILKS